MAKEATVTVDVLNVLAVEELKRKYLELVAEHDRLREAIREADDLLEGMPSGIDEYADPADESPDDATQHVGGLIRQVLRRALKS